MGPENSAPGVLWVEKLLDGLKTGSRRSTWKEKGRLAILEFSSRFLKSKADW